MREGKSILYPVVYWSDRLDVSKGLKLATHFVIINRLAGR